MLEINQLSEPYKTVMIEREINQKQLNDIADDLGWNLSTVKTRLRKARKDVAEVLYKKYPDQIDSYFGNENE
jgi:DNA-directed RNA polymerase specialized sigma24 family protein